MFVRLPFEFSEPLQQAALIVNTVILILALIVVELLYSENPTDRRAHLRYFLPLVFVLAALLLFAVYKQVSKA